MSWLAKNLLKKPGLFELIFNLKTSQNHAKYLKNRTINFLGSNIDRLGFKPQFDQKNWSYGIDFTAKIY